MRERGKGEGNIGREAESGGEFRMVVMRRRCNDEKLKVRGEEKGTKGGRGRKIEREGVERGERKR